MNCKEFGYSYECLEEKVIDTLGSLTSEVKQHQADCLVTAEDLESEIVSGVSKLRNTLNA